MANYIFLKKLTGKNKGHIQKVRNNPIILAAFKKGTWESVNSKVTLQEAKDVEAPKICGGCS